ncbi:MAG: ImmA/IrrE family metallo-endopeptidase [Coriobacteriaceae bacterium]|nr:ImmA/IrrE family metallo-endopeptidase [Coriobacteriaceae bacterium]
MQLPSSRYEEIKRKVVEIFKITREGAIPVNPFCIAHKLGIRMVPYTSLEEGGARAACAISESGFKCYLAPSNKTPLHFIFYNDKMNQGRIRFTILHEIGHIVLGHMQESDVAEAEANFFAKYAIAPPMLVYHIRPNDYTEIEDTFDLSRECALNAWSYYCKWTRITGFTDYEQELESLFTVMTEKGGGRSVKRLRMKKGA